MKLYSLLSAVAVAAFGAFGPAAVALADSPASDAAQTCLQSPQIDYYSVVGATDASPALDFGGLAHGSDETGTFVVAMNHGDCVGFVAENTKGKSSDTNGQKYLVVIFKEVVISSGPLE